MKSKTATAALAATLALCLPAKALLVDTTHIIEVTFSGYPVQDYSTVPQVTFNFTSVDFLNIGESEAWWVYDSNNTLL